MKLYYPVKGAYITQGFGENKLPVYKELGLLGHNGIDFLTGHGTEVYAAHPGEIVYAGVDSNEGFGVVIRNVEEKYKTIYWHITKDIPVRVGQTVKTGDIIGYADNTGLSTGDHLHFGLKPQAEGESDWTWSNSLQDNGFFGAIDPMPFFVNFSAVNASKVEALQKTLDLILNLIVQYPVLATPLGPLLRTITTYIDNLRLN